MAFSEAVNPIKTLFRNAPSYFRPLANEAKMIAKRVVNNAVVPLGRKRSMGIGGAMLMGGGIGAASGAGYDAVTNRRSDWRSMAMAGVMGAGIGAGIGAGAALGLGMRSTYKAGGLGNLRSTATQGFRDMRAGSEAPIRDLRTQFRDFRLGQGRFNFNAKMPSGSTAASAASPQMGLF